MGCHKALLPFDGCPLILYMARLLEPLVGSVTVVGPPESYEPLGLHAIPDDPQSHHAGEPEPPGPLAGITTALSASDAPWNLILACDLPYLSGEWLDLLLARALQSPADAVIPQTAAGIEPLAAVYRRECAVPLAAALAQGVRKVSDAVGRLRVEFLEAREWSGIDPEGLALRNMNSPADYDQACEWWTGKRRLQPAPDTPAPTPATAAGNAIRSSPA
jgi:molybdopterin-guanine dinucleotide biosynthesis protein A